jgi:hypothetical protein
VAKEYGTLSGWSPPCKPNDPVRLNNPRPDEHHAHSPSGNAGLDGYTQVSIADSVSGERKPFGGTPAYTKPPYFED